MSSNESEKRRLIDEINQLLEQSEDSLIPVVRKAARLARLCDELEYRMLFDMHLDGVDMSKASGTRVELWPDQNIQTKWSPVDAFFEDRAVPGKGAMGLPLQQLEQNHALLLKDLDNPKLKDNYQARSMIIEPEQQAHRILIRIQNRVGAFVNLMESNLSEKIKSATKSDVRTESSGTQQPTTPNGLTHALELYEKAKALHQHAKPIDTHIASIIIETANDAIKEFGNTNQEKKIELKRIVKEAEDVLPPATIEELRKRAEGKALKRVHPQNKVLRNAIYAIVVLLVIIGGLFGFMKIFSGKTEEAKVVPSPTPSAAPTPHNQVISLEHDIDRGRRQIPLTPRTNTPKEPITRRIRTKDGFKWVCLNPPTRATLGYWPITYSNDAEACHIYPIVEARLINGEYPTSKEELDRGVRAQKGDEIYVLIYINNGAADNGGEYDPNIAVAKNVSVKTETDTSAGSIHHIKVTASGDNVDTVYGEVKIMTSANEHLEVVSKSGEVRDYTGENVLYDSFDLGNNTIRIGDLKPYFPESLYIRYTVRVVG